MSFRLARMNVFGKRLEKAATTKCYRAEFRKEKGWKKMRVFLKVLYFVNFAAMLSGLLIVTLRQETAYYYCKSVVVKFEDMIWEKALVKFPEDDEYQEFMLNYGNFNGVYELLDRPNGFLGPPVYVEMRKYDQTEFEKTEPATITFCDNRWVLSHPYIHKKRDWTEESDPCNALAMSPSLDGLDLEEADNQDWFVWTGVISSSHVQITCNECHDDVYSANKYETLLSESRPITRSLGCNLNGVCVENECVCDEEEDTLFLGAHCGIKIEKECETIVGEVHNDSWSMEGLEYNRPVYAFNGNMSQVTAALDIPEDTMIMNLVYGGDRWIGYHQNLQGLQEISQEDLRLYAQDYHAFWTLNELQDKIALVSEPTTSETPVGVDMYAVGRKGRQFGPYGELIPLQLYSQTGRGYYQCSGPCSSQVMRQHLGNKHCDKP